MTVAELPAESTTQMDDDVRAIPGVWWIMYVRAGRGAFEIERRYEAELRNLHFDRPEIQAYLPMCHVRRVRNNRMQDWFRPVFPNYLFVAVDGEDNAERMERLYEAVSCLRVCRPQPIRDPDQDSLIEMLSRIQVAEREDTMREGYDDFQPGRKVRVIAGPFRGMEAWVDKRDEKKAQITLNITVLGASRAMQISPEMLELW